MITVQTTFPLGALVATANALEHLTEADIQSALSRHCRRDWGELDDEDKAANDRAADGGGRLLAAYRSRDGTKFWIITEWDRSATTVLLPEDY